MDPNGRSHRKVPRGGILTLMKVSTSGGATVGLRGMEDCVLSTSCYNRTTRAA